jgi:hypothetical protein
MDCGDLISAAYAHAPIIYYYTTLLLSYYVLHNLLYLYIRRPLKPEGMRVYRRRRRPGDRRILNVYGTRRI